VGKPDYHVTVGCSQEAGEFLAFVKLHAVAPPLFLHSFFTDFSQSVFILAETKVPIKTVQ